MKTSLVSLALALSLTALALGGCGGASQQSAVRPLCPRPVSNSNRADECEQRIASFSRAVGLPSGPKLLPALTIEPCRRLTEVVFYAANDWDDLADALASRAASCTVYEISIPPVEGRDGTWTEPAKGVAARLRRLGPQFHALASIRVDAWGPWIAAHPGTTWYDAGREARRRMARAGYDVARGETWALNEIMLPALTSEATRRQMQEFVRGLYEGDGQPAKGIVFSVVPLQDAANVAQYKRQLERWLEDAPFWAAISRAVDVWADEVYVDAQSCCVPGSSLAVRAARLNEYLQARLTLAEAGPLRAAAARAFLARAYVPLGNAAWAWSFGFGNTMIRLEQMKQLVSEQLYAMRLFSASRAEAQSRVGFAWAPRDPSGQLTRQFVVDTNSLLARIASAIQHAVAAGRPEAACGPRGRWCRCQVPGAAFATAWASFASW